MAETGNMLSAYGSLLDVAATENAAIRDNAFKTANLTRGRGSVYLASQAGGMLMSNLAEMAGMKTGAQEKQETIEGILNSNRGLDPNDPKSLYTLGQQFMDAGLTGIGQKFLERGRELEATQVTAAINKQEADAATRTASTSGQVKEGTTRLVGAGDDFPGMQKTQIYTNGEWKDSIDPSTNKVYMQRQFKADAPDAFEKKIEYIKDLKGKVDPTTNLPYTDSTINRMIASVLEGGSGVNITFTGDDAYANELGKLLAIDDQKLVTDSKKAKDQIEKTNSVLRVINRGDANIGAFSTIEQSFDRFKAEFGFSEGEEAASETQLLNALLGSDVFPLINALGIGARGLDTPAERDFLQAVFVGTIKMEGLALEQLTRLRQKYSTMLIQDFNSKVDSDYFDRYNKIATTPLQKIEIPKMVRPNDRDYEVSDGQGGVVQKTYPIKEEDKDPDSPTFGVVRWQYRPDGPYYNERGVDISNQFDDLIVKYVGQD